MIDLVFNQICQQFLKAKIGYWEVIAERYLGKHLTTDLNGVESIQIQKKDNNRQLSKQMTAPNPTHQHSQFKKTVTVGHLADTYWKERVEHLKPGLKKNYVTYDKRIREFFGDETPVVTLDYYKCLDFRDWIKNYRKNPLSSKKVNDYLDNLKGMLNWEMKTTKNLKGIGNPAEGVRDNEPTKSQANVAFTMQELELMFVNSKEYATGSELTQNGGNFQYLVITSNITGGSTTPFNDFIRIRASSSLSVFSGSSFYTHNLPLTGFQQLEG